MATLEHKHQEEINKLTLSIHHLKRIAKMKNFARNAQNEFESIIQQADDELHTSKNSYACRQLGTSQ